MCAPCARENVRATPGEQVNQATKLNTNECAWPPAPAALECLKAIANNQLRLYPDPVSLELRQLVGELWGHPAEGYSRWQWLR